MPILAHFQKIPRSLKDKTITNITSRKNFCFHLLHKKSGGHQMSFKECAVEDLGGRASRITFISRDSWGKCGIPDLYFSDVSVGLYEGVCVYKHVCAPTSKQSRWCQHPIEIFFWFSIALILNFNSLNCNSWQTIFFMMSMFFCTKHRWKWAWKWYSPRFYHNRSICRLCGIKAIQINTDALHESIEMEKY